MCWLRIEPRTVHRRTGSDTVPFRTGANAAAVPNSTRIRNSRHRNARACRIESSSTTTLSTELSCSVSQAMAPIRVAPNESPAILLLRYPPDAPHRARCARWQPRSARRLPRDLRDEPPRRFRGQSAAADCNAIRNRSGCVVFERRERWCRPTDDVGQVVGMQFERTAGACDARRSGSSRSAYRSPTL